MNMTTQQYLVDKVSMNSLGAYGDLFRALLRIFCMICSFAVTYASMSLKIASQTFAMHSDVHSPCVLPRNLSGKKFVFGTKYYNYGAPRYDTEISFLNPSE